MCKEECEILETVICKLEYVIAKKHPLIGQKDFLPTCADLPLSQWPDADDCIRLGVPNVVQIVQVTHGKLTYHILMFFYDLNIHIYKFLF